jgi:hypothetical protein
MSAPHPSFLALDRAVLGDMTEEVRAHLATCSRCSEHVAAVGRPPPVPAWATALADTPRPSRAARWMPWGLGALAALLALVLWVPREAEEPRSRLRIKGGPAVALYVKQGETNDAPVRLWDGESPVAPGELLRLKVMPEGFTWLTVAAADGDSWQVLHEGPVPERGETLLPTSWRVEPGEAPERLLIVLGHAPLSPESLSRLADDAPRTGTQWVFPLTLPKPSSP